MDLSLRGGFPWLSLLKQNAQGATASIPAFAPVALIAAPAGSEGGNTPQMLTTPRAK